MLNWGSFRNSQVQQAQQRPQEGNPPSEGSSSGSSRPVTPSSNSSGGFSLPDRPSSASHVSPAEAAGIIAVVKDKSLDELRKLLSDKDAYQNFLLTLEPLKTQIKFRDELRNGTLQLARENLEKEPPIMELRNQCRIIRTTELAAAEEKLHDLEKRRQELLKLYSPVSLLHQLQDAKKKADDESESLEKQLLDREIDLTTFVQQNKKLRNTYHKRSLTHIAAKTSITG